MSSLHRVKMLRDITPGVQGLAGLAAPIVVFGVVLLYLGVAPLAALLAAVFWVAQGATGAAIIRWLLGSVDLRHAVLIVLGPGALLGIGVSVSLYLLVRGGVLGMVVVACALLIGAVVWGKQSLATTSTNSFIRVADVVVLVGCAIVANSREFPNLLLVGLAFIALGIVWVAGNSSRGRALVSAIALIVSGYGVVSRPAFWWWSSDDTTTLSAIGTMIVERGRVADLAGWPTGSHHWLLHAWLALWNQLSAGQVFETYLLAWPVVAASAALASLWLCCELVLPRNLGVTHFTVIALVTAGLMRLEWPAPQEQQPFLFAMVACCALWLRTHQTQGNFNFLRTVAAMLLLLVAVPAWLFVLKPSLLVAYGLLITGTLLVRFNLVRGWRFAIAAAVSLITIFVGISAMGLGGEWISRRSFTSFAIDYFPADLGWCGDTSTAGSLTCVVSLQAVLIFSAVLAVIVMLFLRRRTNEPPAKISASPLLLMPLALAYLPLRYFVSSGVGSGAPSFYRLPEMALMLLIAIGVARQITSHVVRAREIATLCLVAIVAAFVSRSPSSLYDQVSKWLVSISPLRYLNASDVIALTIAVAGALVCAKSAMFKHWRWGLFTVMMVAVSFTPMTRMALASATETTPAERLSRPADFGPRDIEDVTRWLQNNTKPDVLLATNYLCPSDRLDECTRTTPQVECPRYHPSLMAGWALVALSHREFLYLSQNWDTQTLHFFDHKLSTQLGSGVSRDAIKSLREKGVEYYVASLNHSAPRAWKQLQSVADFTSESFVVVSLATLQQRSNT